MLNFIIRCFLFGLLRLPKVKIFPDWMVFKLQTMFSESYKHDLKLSDIEIVYDSDNANLAKDVKSILDDTGIVVLKKFLNSKITLQNGQEMLTHVSSNYLGCEDEYKEFDDGCVLQREPYRILGYNKLADRRSSLINIRGRRNIGPEKIGDDSGLIDVFQAKHILPQKNKTFIESFERNEMLTQLLKSIHPSLKLRTINFYFNKGGTDPRGLHIDSPSREFKFFLYLTDVDSEKDGPYTFVPFSNKKLALSVVNMVINKFSALKFLITDASFCEPTSALKVLGKAGDLIISNQAAIHGGTPQEHDSSRLMLVAVCY